MDTKEVEQAEVVEEESRTKGTWFLGAIGGGLAGLALGLLWYIFAGGRFHISFLFPVLPGIFIGGLLYRWESINRWGENVSVILIAIATIMILLICALSWSYFIYSMGWIS